jgi:hypothetical protein
MSLFYIQPDFNFFFISGLVDLRPSSAQGFFLHEKADVSVLLPVTTSISKRKLAYITDLEDQEYPVFGQ